MARPECVICDIDYTLSDNSHRRHLKKESLEKFGEEIKNDRLLEPTGRFLKALSLNSEGIKIVFLSCRREMFREQTENWLLESGLRVDELLMREDNDQRPDQDIKKEKMEDYLKNKYRILFAIDDKQSVVQMFRDFGIPCFDVGENLSG